MNDRTSPDTAPSSMPASSLTVLSAVWPPTDAGNAIAMHANTTLAIVGMVWWCIIPPPCRDAVCRQCRSRSASRHMLVKEYVQRESTSYPVPLCLSSTSAHRTAPCSVWLWSALARQPRRAEDAASAGHGMAAGGGAGGMRCWRGSVKVRLYFLSIRVGAHPLALLVLLGQLIKYLIKARCIMALANRENKRPTGVTCGYA